jgi:hypothetical protein
MSKAHTAIFITGLKNVPIKGGVGEMSELIAPDVKRLNLEGFDTEVLAIPNRGDHDTIVTDFKKALQSRDHWDGISIGYGVRGNVALTALFERLVNTALEEVQPPPKLIFTEWVDKVYGSVRRVFPI